MLMTLGTRSRDPSLWWVTASDASDEGMNERGQLQVTDQSRQRALARHGSDDFGVALLAITALRTWRFSLVFHADTSQFEVGRDLCGRVGCRAPSRRDSAVITCSFPQ